MHFDVGHTFAAPPEVVAALLVDPDFMVGVQLPDVAAPSVVVHERTETEARLTLRYEYTGSLDPIAKRVIGSGTLAWIQDLRLDRTTQQGRLSIEAESAPDRFFARADVDVRATSVGCRRRISGDFSIKIPLVGGTAERRLLPGVLRRLDVEADAVVDELARRGRA